MEPFQSAVGAGMLRKAREQRFQMTGPVLLYERIGEANPSRGGIQ
jgi:hypothetical protein